MERSQSRLRRRQFALGAGVLGGSPAAVAGGATWAAGNRTRQSVVMYGQPWHIGH
jgi:hypothetical protein